MALWQFEFSPISAAAARIGGVDAVHLGSDFLNEGYLALPHSQQPALFATLAALLPEQPAWSADMRVWGTPKNSDIQVYFSNSDVVCIEFRLNVSRFSIPLVDEICALARKFRWVFVSKSGAVFQPTREAIIRAAERSPAQEFVKDPAGYLAKDHL